MSIWYPLLVESSGEKCNQSGTKTKLVGISLPRCGDVLISRMCNNIARAQPRPPQKKECASVSQGISA